MKRMKHGVLVVLDGAGAGYQPDADKYGDVGANTLGHVIEQEHPEIPNLTEMGLLKTIGMHPEDEDDPIGCYGTMLERAAGKDTTTGHWELAGLTLEKPFPTYPNGFPQEVIDEFERETDAIVVEFGVSRAAVLDVVFGDYEPTGRLPIQIPKDMETVEAQSEDRALDMEPHVDEAGNAYDYGFGLNYSGVIGQ